MKTKRKSRRARHRRLPIHPERFSVFYSYRYPGVVSFDSPPWYTIYINSVSDIKKYIVYQDVQICNPTGNKYVGVYDLSYILIKVMDMMFAGVHWTTEVFMHISTDQFNVENHILEIK